MASRKTYGYCPVQRTAQKGFHLHTCAPGRFGLPPIWRCRWRHPRPPSPRRREPCRPGDVARASRLRTTPQTLLQLVRDRWSIEGWHWIRDTQLHEDAHRCRSNGAGAMATLRTAALNLLRLAGFRSIRSGMQAVMHDITALLAMARRRAQPNQG